MNQTYPSRSRTSTISIAPGYQIVIDKHSNHDLKTLCAVTANHRSKTPGETRLHWTTLGHYGSVPGALKAAADHAAKQGNPDLAEYCHRYKAFIESVEVPSSLTEAA